MSQTLLRRPDRAYRKTAAAKYAANLALARRPDFVARVRAFLVAHHVRVVRVHTGGEFFSARYARKWRRIMRRSPRVRFFTYTRAWRVPAIKAVLGDIAGLPNARVWYSCDRETGLPADIPDRVHIAWLMADEDDRPPAGSDLVFRVRRLRSRPASTIGGVPVCPAEDGTARAARPTCDRCRLCWRRRSGDAGRLPLPLLDRPPAPGLARRDG